MQNNKLFGFIIKRKFTLLAFVYLLAICFSSSLFLLPTKMFFLCILNIFSIMLILNLLAKIKYTSFIVIILAILLSFNAYFAFVYKSTVTIGIMASVFETSISETISVFSDFYVLILAIILLSATSFLLLKSREELKSSKLTAIKTSILLAIYFIIILPGSFWFKANKDSYFNKQYVVNKPLTIQLISKYCTPIIYCDIITAIVYKIDIAAIQKYATTVRNLPAGVDSNTDAETPEKIYLIIGESAYSKHMSLYGYNKITTPFFDSLKKDSLIDFKHYDAISPAALTRDAFRLILSFATPSNPKPFYDNKNIIELANDKEYETIWLSSQAKAGVFDSFIGNIAACASYSYFSKENNADDFELYKYFKEKKKESKKQFFLINLIGSHLTYNTRYDKTDKQALSDDYPASDYDRSIHHTDRFLKGFYELIKQDSSFVFIYLSDHGEIVNKGHGLLNEGAAQFEIPFVTINNSKTHLDSIVNLYKNHEIRMINTSNLVYILSNIIGYNIDNDSIKKHISDGKYIFHSDMNTYLFENIKKDDR